MRIGINGFGRIGRLFLRSALARGVERDYLERAMRMVSFAPEEPPL